MLHREGREDWSPALLHPKFMVHRSGGEDPVPSPLHPRSMAHRSDGENPVPSPLQWESMVHGSKGVDLLRSITSAQLASGLPGILGQDCLIWYLLTSPKLLSTHIFIIKVNILC